jgi:hypothetical protein
MDVFNPTQKVSINAKQGSNMALNLLKDKGVPLAKQCFTWKELVQPSFSKLDDDAFTRVRVILMNSIESEALRFSHSCARMNHDHRTDFCRSPGAAALCRNCVDRRATHHAV